MTKNLNSATRLYRILKKAGTFPDNLQAVDVCAQLLQVQSDHPIRKAVAVGDLLRAMHHELEIAAARLVTASFSKSLYEAPFSRIENAISPLLLPHTWNQVKQYLTPEVLTALAFCTEILPDEESQISTEDLAVIRKKLDELREAASAPDTAPRLRVLIQHHVSLIEGALAEYLIVGAKALREAGRTALGEMIEVRDEIAPEKGSPAVTKLESTWKSVNNAADLALKGEKLVQLGQKAWDALSGLF